MEQQTKFKNNDYVRITTGKFRGWRGLVGLNIEQEQGINYYTIFAREKKTRRGVINKDVVGLGLIMNIPQHHLKEVLK
jgi:ribosomal protein L24